MTPELVGQIVVAGVSLVAAGTGGVAAWLGKRVLNGQDELKTTVTQQGERIVAMEVKLPNGEWRAIKDDVAALHTSVREVKDEVGGHRIDLKELRAELNQHITDENAMMGDVRLVVGNCKSLLAQRQQRKKSSKRRARR